MTLTRPSLADAPRERFGPATVAHWSQEAQLDDLGVYCMEFQTTGESEPWTVSYEESIVALDGSSWVIEIADEGDRRVPVQRDQVLILSRGTTVRYGGEAGARLLLTIAPLAGQSEAGAEQ